MSKPTSEMLQQLNLSKRPLGQDLLTENIGDLLDRDAFAGLVVRRSAVDKVSVMPSSRTSDSIPDYAISTLPQLLGDIVALVDNELLVEDLEDLAPL